MTQTYNSGLWKSISIVGQLALDIFDDIRFRTKHQEHSQGDAAAALLNIASNQANSSARLGSAISEVISE